METTEKKLEDRESLINHFEGQGLFDPEQTKVLRFEMNNPFEAAQKKQQEDLSQVFLHGNFAIPTYSALFFAS